MVANWVRSPIACSTSTWKAMPEPGLVSNRPALPMLREYLLGTRGGDDEENDVAGLPEVESEERLLGYQPLAADAGDDRGTGCPGLPSRLDNLVGARVVDQRDDQFQLHVASSLERLACRTRFSQVVAML